MRMGRRKTQKIIRTTQRNSTIGRCPHCRTIGKIFLLGKPGQEKCKCDKCRGEFDI